MKTLISLGMKLIIQLLCLDIINVLLEIVKTKSVF